MLGPAANHYITVSHASNFTWRDSHFRDLIGLMGDGLLTIDGEFHRRSRLIMLPAFHHEHIAASVDVMVEETDRALDRVHARRPIDLYAWTRRLALRVAMRALFGLDPDGERARSIDAAGLFEQALSFYSSDYVLRMLRGPVHALGAHAAGRARARHADLLGDLPPPRHRRAGRGHPQPAARRPRRGRHHAHRPADPRRGDDADVRRPRHHHLDRRLHVLRARPQPRDRRAPARRAGRPARRTAARPPPSSPRGELTELELVLDETLRKYPPAWVGPRRSIEPFEFEGHTVPGARVRQLLLLGLPPPARRVPRPRGVPPRALHARGQGRAAQGRLRPLRRRLAHVHRHALRPARGPRDRHAHPLPLHALAARRTSS